MARHTGAPLPAGTLPGRRLCGTFWAAICLLTALVGVFGCSEEEPQITFPKRPEPIRPTWFFAIDGFVDQGGEKIYVAGQPGIILFYDESTGNWVQQNTPTTEPLISVHVRDANDVFTCGHNGIILRKTGSTWVRMESGTREDLFAIGSFQGNMYAAGRFGALKRLTGGSWSETATFMVRRDPLTGAVTDTIYRDQDIESLTTITHWGIAGSNGFVLMPDIESPPPPGIRYEWLVRYVGVNQEDWVLGGNSNSQDTESNYLCTDLGRLYRLRDFDKAWGALSDLNPDEIPITNLWADADTLYMTTRNGDVWRRNPSETPYQVYEGREMLYGIWGSSNESIWAVGIDATVIHFNGSEWVDVDVGIPRTKSSLPLLDKFGRPLH